MTSPHKTYKTYITTSGRPVGVRQGIGDDWITVYLDHDQKGGRVRCTQIPVAPTRIAEQIELNNYAHDHGWKEAAE